MAQLQELLNRRSAGDFVGRCEELAVLSQTLGDDAPYVVHLHGIAGSGKSALLGTFAQQARDAGATIIRLDCQSIEPTQAGFLSELAVATGGKPKSVDDAAQRLGRLGGRVVLALDTYEAFRLMDSWLRQIFVPQLPDNVRLILCGREAPVTAWLTAPGWRALFKSIEIGPLDQRSALEFLVRAGVAPDEAKRLDSICHGHPLALTLAASLQGNSRASLSSGLGEQIVEELCRVFVADITDPQTRRALQASSVVRRVTVPLLGAILPDTSPQDALERVRSLPFVQGDKDGLRIHDAVREAVALTLRAENPQLYREYRRAAYQHFLAELRTATSADFWRCTANLLYVLENPVVREAFFPSGAQEYVVEPAQAQDEARILDIIERHEQPALAKSLVRWWKRAPEIFFAVRDPKGTAVGFYCVSDAKQFSAMSYRDDPVTQDWLGHLARNPIPQHQCALFLRRWLAEETGEAPSPVQAAAWLDLKRKYLELRPNLRRVYLTVSDLAPYAAVAARLGFQVLPTRPHPSQWSAMLDFGASSVDGWLSRLVAQELGVEQEGLLDYHARELVLNGKRVGLSKLEFGVMDYLQRHSGEAVSRMALLENVWQQSYDGGSNVVDVVIRGLRKKLGDKADVLESVHGVGYRFRLER